MSWTAARVWVTGEVVTSAIMNTYVSADLTALKDTLQGDPGTTGLIHEHLSGTFAAMPAPGNVGRAYLATDRVELYIDFGTAWVKQLSIPDLKQHWFYPLKGSPFA